MNFENLKMRFACYRNTPMTIYTWGKKKHMLGIAEMKTQYSIVYNGKDIKGFCYLTTELPKLLAITIEQLYNGFGVDSREIESCIKSIQAWEKRKDRHV